MPRDLRRTWIPLIRIAGTSTADLAADWFYYGWVDENENPDLEKYEMSLFVFFWVSVAMCSLTFVGIFIKGCCSGGDKSRSQLLARQFNKVLGLEILLEDIPQFILTSLITVERGALSMTGAFNMATSGFNLFTNILEICEPEDDDDDDDDGDGGKVGDKAIVDDPETQPGDMNVVID